MTDKPRFDTHALTVCTDCGSHELHELAAFLPTMGVNSQLLEHYFHQHKNPRTRVAIIARVCSVCGFMARQDLLRIDHYLAVRHERCGQWILVGLLEDLSQPHKHICIGCLTPAPEFTILHQEMAPMPYPELKLFFEV